MLVEPHPVAVFIVRRSRLLSSRAEAMLPFDEQRRAERFDTPAAKCRFIWGRALSRRVLGEALGCSPPDVSIGVDDKGKPTLSCGGLGFSLSHSIDHTAVAISPGAKIGVDIETLRPFPRSVVGRFFSPHERRWIASGSDAAADLRAWRVWTSKEAVAKIDGRGMTPPLPVLSTPLRKLSEQAGVCLYSAVQGDLCLAVAADTASVEAGVPSVHLLDPWDVPRGDPSPRAGVA